jgi:hypothetical protein
MRWLDRFSALTRRGSRLAAKQAEASIGPESEIRKRVKATGDVAIRTVVPLGGGKHLKALRALEDLYFEQRCALEERFRLMGIGVFVADYALAMPEQSPPFGYCVWTQGVPTLLPETDVVVLSNIAVEISDHWEVIVPWADLLRVTGDACVVQEPALIPLRWRTVTWPDRRMLAELRAAALHY